MTEKTHEHVMALRAGYEGEIWAECVDMDCEFRIEEIEIISVIQTRHKWVLSDEVYGIRQKQLDKKRAAMNAGDEGRDV